MKVTVPDVGATVLVPERVLEPELFLIDTVTDGEYEELMLPLASAPERATEKVLPARVFEG